MSKLLARNEGSIDRILRVAVGLFVLSLMFWGPQTWWAAVGIIPLATGLLGSCPLYTLLGLSTCPVRSGQSG